MRWLLAAACVPLAHGAVSGVPEPGPTGLLPRASISTTNDMLGNGVGNGDDFRTAGVGGHYASRGLVLAIDAAMLTDRNGSTRSDELVATAAWSWGQAAPALGWRWSGLVGGGLRLDRYLGGDVIQNGLHRGINAPEVDAEYDDVNSLAPVLAGSGALGYLSRSRLPFLTGWWGGQLVGSSSYAVDGELIIEGGPRLTLVGRDGSFWAGARYRWQAGDPVGPTLAATGQHEQGWWVDSGTFVTPVDWGGWGYQVRAGLNLETLAVNGALGAVYRPGTASPGEEMEMQHDLSVYQGGAFGVQLRWYPTALQLQGSRRPAVAFDYRFGTEPDGRISLDLSPNRIPTGADLRFDQVTVGWEEGWVAPILATVDLVPYLQVGAGGRREGVVSEGVGVRAESVAPVVSGALGCRVVFFQTVSLGLSIDGWLPVYSEDVTLGGSTVTLNDPGWNIGGHLAAHIAW